MTITRSGEDEKLFYRSSIKKRPHQKDPPSKRDPYTLNVVNATRKGRKMIDIEFCALNNNVFVSNNFDQDRNYTM